jgi:hypothetical protein
MSQGNILARLPLPARPVAGAVREVLVRINALPSFARRPAFAAAALVVSAAASPPATSAEFTIDDLKGAYLACERATAAGKLGDAHVMECSVIYEELKQRAFGGDFRSLRTWHESVWPRISS